MLPGTALLQPGQTQRAKTSLTTPTPTIFLNGDIAFSHDAVPAGGGSICQHGRRRSRCKECGDHRCGQCNRAFCSAQALKEHIEREVCSTRNRQQPGTKRKRTEENTTPLQGPKRSRTAEEPRDEDDDIPPAPGVIFDSAALVNDEATEPVSHQPEQGEEQGVSRSAVEEFIIFESAHK